MPVPLNALLILLGLAAATALILAANGFHPTRVAATDRRTRLDRKARHARQ